MGFSLRLAIALAGFWGPAAAQCPVPGDLETGIALRDDTGGVTTYTAPPGRGEVSETTLFEDNSGFFVRSIGGLLVAESYDLENGEMVEDTLVHTEFVSPRDAFPVAEGRQIILQGTELAGDGTQTQISVAIETSLMRKVLYGDCIMQAIPVRLTYDYAGEAREVEYIDYLPEFGISVFLGAGNAGGAPDIYRVLDIYKVPPE